MSRKRSGLPARYSEIRKEIVRTHGCAMTADLMAKFNVSRSVVARARVAIRKLHPVKPAPWDEAAEITRSLQAFEDHEDMISDELERVDEEIKAQTGTGTAAALFNCRCNLLGQLRDIQDKRSRYLMSVGYVTEAAKRLQLLTPVAELSGDALKIEAERLEDLVGSGADGANDS
jgi:hypothetical protein